MREDGSLRVVVRAHWVNAAVLVPFARPYVRVDGQEHSCRWGDELTVDVQPGHHVVESFIRYKGTSAKLGTGYLEVDVAPGARLQIEAKNGWMNHMPFRPRLVSR